MEVLGRARRATQLLIRLPWLASGREAEGAICELVLSENSKVFIVT
jgi:hypothetical protein